MLSSLALGTVQFGLPYGVANQNGQVDLEEISFILDESWRHGIRMIDTAIAYGESEKRLGQIGVSNWQIISKLPPIPSDIQNVKKWAIEMVEGSLFRLGVSSLKGLLLHKSDLLLEPGGEKLYEALIHLKGTGLVDQIGVSVYDPAHIDLYIKKFVIDIVQLPLNVLDRRLLNSTWFSAIKRKKIEIHVRSVFLQGLLLMDPNKRPDYFSRWNTIFEDWDCWLKENRISPLEACLGFVGSVTGIDRVIVGVDSKKHIMEILNVCKSNCFLKIPDHISSEDENLLLPYNWKLQ
ncbi:aldo/keto reductase [Leptospira interrogans]|uniref:aldo/keto reductase n=1 Tax=Leptospira interrogans TaxID=173 RepID=UPI001F075C8B|nr:aldo/keto reductase [Leptospira interrogans]UML83594.1 aldo/keto reductase [Leptospira interrogans]